ncbi:hypothetical protein GCM10008171_22480 [Methylopila jiangsuensis]|uniref:Uncharacterized protein n=1 Tax=Methylopila jiangsuensis TaxID=586230 RepID=A0A9W6JJ39_9HYPH|nr:hypothetical protein GCM10008171_22480 [Methylopila jiangsuensis]
MGGVSGMRVAQALQGAPFAVHIARGRLAMGVFLANRVRSERKQPQRDRYGSSSDLPPLPPTA